ncbi:heavy-metal-associated domain-containing protein [Mucilaginibacter roseus]|uniref:Heavy-metal-associated domain-containing protein n=1 Tax=Mucilaginibacter roseus TaxID=1528868 RepID=A0ABS8U6W6_9SPHI|nr:heavy-metal-associated domain-containing protein [Mucilaginibacter roseus]MCD8741905.1 heavy-metal-associated domain-containing protein [Mucilaginibacter roseus]
METLKFKTNIKCGGCIAAVTPALNSLEGVIDWQVDVASPEKVLTINSDDALSEQAVITALKEKGYQAESI